MTIGSWAWCIVQAWPVIIAAAALAGILGWAIGRWVR